MAITQRATDIDQIAANTDLGTDPPLDVYAYLMRELDGVVVDRWGHLATVDDDERGRE